MQCSCGATTITRDRPKVQNGVVVAKVELDECPQCTRVGCMRLFEHNDEGVLVMIFNDHPANYNP